MIAREAEAISRFREAAALLESQGANPFRVAAYRKGADAVTACPDVRALYLAERREGLMRLPGVGPRLASAIAEMLDTGRWAQLERLRGSLDPSTLFRTVPGIGPGLAERIHDALHVETLEGLEAACADGRLERVPGMGPRRLAMVRTALATALARVPRERPGDGEPDVGVLLDVDREYREAVAAKRLPTIAPRRFNAEGKAWLPVLHTHRGDWHFTALYSNTATAHRLRRTRDWVVLYFDDDRHHGERQRTVVTERRGALAGRRVVRGREDECVAHYGASVPRPARRPIDVAQGAPPLPARS
jgi:hypothetical protein